MSLQTDYFFSQIPYFDQLLEGPRSLNYQQRNISMEAVRLPEKKSNTGSVKNQDDKSSDIKTILDISNPYSEQQKSQNAHSRLNLSTITKPKQYKSLLFETMNKKIRSGKTQVTVYFFETKKRIVFIKNQLNKIFAIDPKLDNSGKLEPTVKFLIPYIMKHYCKLFLNFQPIEIDHETFELKLADLDNCEDKNIDPINHEEQISRLYQCSNLVLVRKERSRQKILKWQLSLKKTDHPQMQAIQIITPKRRELVEHFQKTKNISFLKQKVLSYGQLGKIIIVTYQSFKICESKKKISDIVLIDRVLEVYREKVTTFEDIQIYKKNKISLNEEIQTFTEQHQQKILLQAEFEVNQSYFWGRLYLQISGTTITQKYDGGVFGMILNSQRKIERSVYTLTGISCSKLQNKILLQFMSMDGPYKIQYYFDNKTQRDQFFKVILKIGRQLKQNYEKI